MNIEEWRWNFILDRVQKDKKLSHSSFQHELLKKRLGFDNEEDGMGSQHVYY